MRRLFALLALVVLLLVACSGPAVICNTPYMLKGTECCLDNNANHVCDADEGAAPAAAPANCPAVDCSTCPATVVSKNVTQTVTKYVCAKTMAQVDDPAQCAGPKNAFADYALVDTNENGTAIVSFTARPACRDSLHAAELYFKVDSPYASATVQVKEAPEGAWQDVYVYNNSVTDHYLYGVFCDSQCTGAADFFLSPGKAYVVRMKFDYKRTFGLYQFSNERLLDDTDEGPYATKLC